MFTWINRSPDHRGFVTNLGGHLAQFRR